MVRFFAIFCLALFSSGSIADTRDAEAFKKWVASSGNEEKVNDFTSALDRQGVSNLFPSYMILRSASDWSKCKASPFSVPPAAYQNNLSKTLALAAELKRRGLMPSGEPVSIYRNKQLNYCAGGADDSAHLTASAIDFSPASSDNVNELCRFWREEGRSWNMGISVYPKSRRIHIDTKRYRTWPVKNPVCLTKHF